MTWLFLGTAALIGLGTMAVGCLLFVPASDSGVYATFLLALFVLAAGITVLQVAANVAEIPIDAARSSAQLLLRAEMVHERMDIQREEFSFRHPLIQEAAYRSLLSERRKRLHRAAACLRAGSFGFPVRHGA